MINITGQHNSYGCFKMNRKIIMKKGMAIGLICLLFIPLSSVAIGKCENSNQTSEDFENKQFGIYFVYAGGKSTLMGCSAGAHISPFWFQTRSRWVSYGFDGPTVIFINGIPTFHTEPVRIYMEGFKGLAPGSIHWGVKSFIGARIRIVGICTYLEIH